jgi:hypothetical protein
MAAPGLETHRLRRIRALVRNRFDDRSEWDSVDGPQARE